MMADVKVHGNTKKAANIALAKRQISRDSHKAVHEGRLTLPKAKELGRGRGPDTPVRRSAPGTAPERARRASAEDAESGTDTVQTFCLCGCGEPVFRSFKPGHDAKLRSELMAQIKKGDVLLRSERITPEQRAFAVRHGLIGEEALPEEERDG